MRCRRSRHLVGMSFLMDIDQELQDLQAAYIIKNVCGGTRSRQELCEGERVEPFPPPPEWSMRMEWELMRLRQRLDEPRKSSGNEGINILGANHFSRCSHKVHHHGTAALREKFEVMVMAGTDVIGLALREKFEVMVMAGTEVIGLALREKFEEMLMGRYGRDRARHWRKRSRRRSGLARWWTRR